MKDGRENNLHVNQCFLSMHVLISNYFPIISELPYGWEKIDDPIYGTYYVE